MKKQQHSEKILQFKVVLNDSVPRIWRRIVVPADYTFFALHCAIQNAMGWTDSHLHAFRVGERRGRDRITIQFPDPEMEDWGGDTRDERKEHVSDYFGKTIKQCVYDYDFGDSWEHTILLERELPHDPKAVYPQCTGGENACPPEDCGGVWGYENLQKILKDPKHKEHADMLEWLCIDDPEEFNPHEFNPAEIEFENPKQRLKEWNKGFGV